MKKIDSNILTQLYILYDILAKLAPLHSYVNWYMPKEFGTYTNSIGSLISTNLFTAVLVLVIVFLIATICRLKKEIRSVDKPKAKTRCERYQRSVK
ncbi:hypothetical protein ACUN13_29445 [Bacillus cereus group sp. Bce041]|uniref:hypothetical protein n=1 Tax=Bacillus cereus group sp. Bce041 TaxID=3445228 RepID=UPI004042CBCC